MSWGNITDLPVLKYAAIQQATFAAEYARETFTGDDLDYFYTETD